MLSLLCFQQLEELRKQAEKLVEEISLDEFDLDLVPENFRRDLQFVIDYIDLENIVVAGFQNLVRFYFLQIQVYCFGVLEKYGLNWAAEALQMDLKE